MSTPRFVMFACNDYRNGIGQGWFDSVHYDEWELQLDGPRLTLKFIDDRRVRIGRRIFMHRGWREWVGNWCWDGIHIEDFNELLRYLRCRGYTCNNGPSRLFQWFNQAPTSTEPT